VLSNENFSKFLIARSSKMQENLKCIGFTGGIVTLKVLILREEGDQEVVGRVSHKSPQISLT